MSSSAASVLVGLLGRRGGRFVDRRRRRRGRRFGRGPVGEGQRAERGRDPGAIRREVGEHAERRPDGRDRDEIRGGHLLVDVLPGRLHRALHVLGLHRADVEDQRDQPPAGHHVGRHRRRAAAAGSGFAARRPVGAARPRVLGHLRLDTRQQVGRLERRQRLLRDLLEGEAAIVCGRPSSRISKSAAVKPRTTAPDLSRTMTSTETTLRLRAEHRPLLGAAVPTAGSGEHGDGGDGSTAAATHRITVQAHRVVCRRRQNRNLTLSCIDRIGRTESTWPKVGELTTVSMPA